MSVNAWTPVACALAFFSAFAQSQVLDFPSHFRFIYVSSASAPTEDLRACYALVRSKITKGFFGWDYANLNCTYGEAIYGFIYGDDNVVPAALVSTSSTEVIRVNSTEAETYMMNEVYGSSECPVNTTVWGKWCVTQKRVHGVYTAGRFRNGTMLVLSRTDVSISLNYSCDTPFSIRMIFGGKWYCYTRFDNIGALNYDTILTNRCASLQPGSSVIKLTEADRECGFLTENRAGYEVYLGLIQPNAVPKTAASYKYYDGSSAGTLPWATARPNVTDAKKNLVICDNVERGHVTDVTALSFKSLFCKKPATPQYTSTTTTTPTSTSSTTVTTTTIVPTTSTRTPMTTTTILTTTKTSAPTTTVTTCEPPNPMQQVGLTVEDGVNEVDGNMAVAECTTCLTGTRKFWQTITEKNPEDAFASAREAIGVRCTEMVKFCVCDKDDVCYSPGATAPRTVYFHPYCTNEICHMYAVQRGPDEASLVSTSTDTPKTYSAGEQFKAGEDRVYFDMDPMLDPQVYIYASKVSCSGCTNIQSDTCTGPAIPVTG